MGVYCLTTCTSPCSPVPRSGSLPDKIYAYVVESILRGDYARDRQIADGNPACRSLQRFEADRSRGAVAPALRRCRHLAPWRGQLYRPASRVPGRRAADQEPGRRRALLRVPHLRRGRRRGRSRRVPHRRRHRCHAGGAGCLVSGNPGGTQGHRGGRAFPPGDRPRFAQPVFRVEPEASVGPIRQFIELARNVAQRKDDTRDREVQREHQAILDAIVRRSPAEAVEATRAHTVAARRRIFEGTQLLT